MTTKIGDVELIKILYPSGVVDFSRVSIEINAAHKVLDTFFKVRGTPVKQVTGTKRSRKPGVDERAVELLTLLKGGRTFSKSQLCNLLGSGATTVNKLINVLQRGGHNVIVRGKRHSGRYGFANMVSLEDK